jgi:predicted nucleic acid-binding protein
MEWSERPGHIRWRGSVTWCSRIPADYPYTEQTAYEHARIWAELEVSGKMIGFYDLIVGATALERGSEVATFNKRHFGQIRGLRVIDPK